MRQTSHWTISTPNTPKAELCKSVYCMTRTVTGLSPSDFSIFSFAPKPFIKVRQPNIFREQP